MDDVDWVGFMIALFMTVIVMGMCVMACRGGIGSVEITVCYVCGSAVSLMVYQWHREDCSVINKEFLESLPKSKVIKSSNALNDKVAK
jgi:hypothetical protein